MRQNMGVPASPSGHSRAEPEEVSVVPTSVPNAVTISGELYAFLMGEGPLEGVWFGDFNEGFRGAFWWRALLRCAAGWPAKEASNECPECHGRGERWVQAGGLPRAPYPAQCDYCHGTGTMAVSGEEIPPFDAIAIEAAEPLRREAGSTRKGESAGLEEASPDTSSQTPAPKE